MDPIEAFVLGHVIKFYRRRARQQPKKRAQHMRTIIRAKRKLRKGAVH